MAKNKVTADTVTLANTTPEAKQLPQGVDRELTNGLYVPPARAERFSGNEVSGPVIVDEVSEGPITPPADGEALGFEEAKPSEDLGSQSDGTPDVQGDKEVTGEDIAFNVLTRLKAVEDLAMETSKALIGHVEWSNGINAQLTEMSKLVGTLEGAMRAAGLSVKRADTQFGSIDDLPKVEELGK